MKRINITKHFSRYRNISNFKFGPKQSSSASTGDTNVYFNQKKIYKIFLNNILIYFTVSFQMVIAGGQKVHKNFKKLQN